MASAGRDGESPGAAGDGSRGVRHHVQHGIEVAKGKYAGSSAEDLWRRLESVDFLNRGMVCAATLLLCFFPFLIVASAVAGRSIVSGLARRLGLNKQAAADVGHLFSSSSATSAAVTGTGWVFLILSGLVAAAAVQQLYQQAFDLDRRKGDMLRALIWLAVLGGGMFVAGWAGPGVRDAAGPVLFGVIGVAVFTCFWWFTMWFLLAGRTSWGDLFPAAVATAVFWVGMEAVFAVVFSGMVISNDEKYGPIGIMFSLLSWLIAIGVVIILGAVAGIVWHERGLSFRAAASKLRRAR
jgi:membrane protein